MLAKVLNTPLIVVFKKLIQSTFIYDEENWKKIEKTIHEDFCHLFAGR